MVRRWDKWKNPWDREYAKRGRLWRGSADLGAIARFLDSVGRVLELGCGDGKLLRPLATSGRSVVGVDLSRHALRLARTETSFPLVQADARRLPFCDGAFDAVTARYLLGALPEPDRREAAREMVRVTKPSGTLLLEDFSVGDFRFGKGRAVEPGTFERNQGILTHYFDAGEHCALFPASMSLVHEEVVEGEQRVGAARQQRRSLRIVLRT